MTTPSADRLRVLFVISQDSGGGAARAVHRIYRAIRDSLLELVDIRMRVIHKTYDDERIIGGKPTRSRLEYAQYFLRTRFRKYFPRKPFVSDNTLIHSQALYPSGLGRELNEMDVDVIMLGWLGNSTLSIPEIGRLKAPVVWRLSDMWMFSGAEHYTAHSRYEVGYRKNSRPANESGPDIDRETFLRKKRHWRHPRHVIAPSQWMAEQVKRSTLTRDWPVHVIPNPIDTDYWEPQPRSSSRTRFGFPDDAIVILFGTGGGTKNHHKGGDLLLGSLSTVGHILQKAGHAGPVICAIFGEERPTEYRGGVEVRFLDRLDDEDLKAAYSASDVMVVPSRLDNLPSTAVEAQACATPVVAFRVGGLPDIVEDGITGRIVEPFDTDALAEAIVWCVSERERNDSLSHAARNRAETLWRPEIIARQYVDVLTIAAEKNGRVMDASSPNELADSSGARGGDTNPPIVVRLMSQRGAQGFEGLASRFPGGTLDQGDVVFTTDDTDSDVVIVQNYLRYDTRVTARDGYIWKWDNEPIVRRPFARGLDRIYTHADAAGDTRVHTAPPVLDWWVNKSFDELASLEPPAKTLMTSAIASNKILIEGHRKRVEFIDRVSQELPGVEIFGEGRARELDDKWDGLAPYRFSIAIENTSKSDYWSEKIADCFLSYTVPLYFGATNISDYFPSDSFIWLPIDSPDEALGIIRELNAEDWERRLPAVIEARERVLGRYSFALQVMGRIRAEREAILASAKTSRVIQGRRTKPGGWIRGAGLLGNVTAQINRRNARRGEATPSL